MSTSEEREAENVKYLQAACEEVGLILDSADICGQIISRNGKIIYTNQGLGIGFDGAFGFVEGYKQGINFMRSGK